MRPSRRASRPSPHHTSRRGYVSFLFMIPLALLLLMPLTLQQGPEDSLVSIYPADSTLAEQVALERALLRAAHASILEVKNNISDSLELSAVAFGVPEAKIADVVLEALPSEDQKIQVVRYAVLSNWSQTLRLWNQHSDYSVHLYCGQPSNLSAPMEFDHMMGADGSPLSYSPSWQACSQFIERDRQLTLGLQRPYLITPGFEIRVEHRFFNYSGASPMRPQEVG